MDQKRSFLHHGSKCATRVLFVPSTTVELLRSQDGQNSRACQWHILATAWCMRRQRDQAKMGSKASPTVSNKRLMRWRISHTLRSTIGRDGASFPVGGGDALSLTRMATRKARASMASVMWRYQPCQERTS